LRPRSCRARRPTASPSPAAPRTRNAPWVPSSTLHASVPLSLSLYSLWPTHRNLGPWGHDVRELITCTTAFLAFQVPPGSRRPTWPRPATRRPASPTGSPRSSRSTSTPTSPWPRRATPRTSPYSHPPARTPDTNVLVTHHRVLRVSCVVCRVVVLLPQNNCHAVQFNSCDGTAWYTRVRNVYSCTGYAPERTATPHMHSR
jgi:hypothetical protein